MGDERAQVMNEALDTTKECPIIYAMNLLSSKWMMPIIWHLLVDGPLSYNDLLRILKDISNTMLTRCLKSLTDNSLVDRKDLGGAPPRVIYSISEKGRGLLPAMQCLFDWGNEMMDTDGTGKTE